MKSFSASCNRAISTVEPAITATIYSGYLLSASLLPTSNLQRMRVLNDKSSSSKLATLNLTSCPRKVTKNNSVIGSICGRYKGDTGRPLGSTHLICPPS